MAKGMKQSAKSVKKANYRNGKSNWKRLSERSYGDTLHGRDVYESQQLDRGKLPQMQTMFGRTIVAIAAGLLVFSLVYFMWAVFASAIGGAKTNIDNTTSQPVNNSGGDINQNNNQNTNQPFNDIDTNHAYDWLTDPDEYYNNNTSKVEDIVNTILDFGTVTVYASDFGNVDTSDAYGWLTDPDTYYNKNGTQNNNGGSQNNVVNYFTGDVSQYSALYGLVDDYNNEVSYINENGEYGYIDENNKVRAYSPKNYVYVLRNIYTGEYVNQNTNMSQAQNADIQSNQKDTKSNQSKGQTSKKSQVINLKPTSKWQLIISFVAGFITFALLFNFFRKNLVAQNLLADTSDINQYDNDQHITLPREMIEHPDFVPVPDVGCHFTGEVNSMIGHVSFLPKGLKNVKVARRYDKDVIGKNSGNILHYEGEIKYDKEDKPLTVDKPIIDIDFSNENFKVSSIPENMIERFDATKLPYNPDNANRNRLKGYNTVADMINGDWEFPIYETQRPGGAYIFDTQPVNTMVLAITRAGKGQTIIEPTIDVWTREKRLNNIVINDPKGELLVKFYVPMAFRGFQIVQFNLINVMKTDIYNPLGLAANAAREGNFTDAAMYVENIAEVFFPTDGGDDPFWPNAANNAFKRAAYGLIDYYLELEKAYRIDCQVRIENGEHVDLQRMETIIDQLWGKVTLFNCYQMFVQLSSKKTKNPLVEFANKQKAGEFANLTDEELQEKAAEADAFGKIWDNAPELDNLSLYFKATEMLPRNSMRGLIANADNALKAMGGSEKTIASVYGIAITSMSFFTDPTISTLTSGTPSQTVDLAGLSFPRRMGVRFHNDFFKKNHYVGLQCRWDSFEDKFFTKSLGKDFEHSDIISREGWARYYFDGKYKNDIAYVRLRLYNPTTNMRVATYYFEYHKGYQTSLDGRSYVKDPILGTKIGKDGVLFELLPVKKKSKRTGEMVTIYRRGDTKFNIDHAAVEFEVNDYDLKSDYYYTIHKEQTPAITQKYVKYNEKPKAVFLVTPPHLMKYAKLLLILIKQLFDLNVNQSYMTKDSQKPLYLTRYMLDELGNLQSEGHGINGFETMLSIGLGQGQQYTLILQTLQQLKAVYGDDVDKIVQGNAQPLDALIATPNGWKYMGDICLGDEVLTPYGDVTTVIGVYPKGVRPVYRVTLRDGSSTEVCNQHLWEIERYKTVLEYKGIDENGKKIYVKPDNGKTCELIREVIDTDELKRRVDKGRQINLPKIKPVVYSEIDLPIHPYVLGVILGDGNIDSKGHVTITIAEKDNEIIDMLMSLGYELTRSNSKSKFKTPVYYLKGVTSIMRDLGLVGHRSWEKFIPSMYLFSSVEQRIWLLRGIMDTDGTISKKSEMEFTSSSYEFAEDVQSLVRSLGGRVSINIKTNVNYTSPNQKTKKQGRIAYRVQNIRLSDINPFYLKRKAERWVNRVDNSGNRIIAVDYIRDDIVQCIRVADERHLYITDDYMPTHNTSNIVFLKSTDDQMIETLSKMSGVTHKTFIEQKTVTRDVEAMAGSLTANDGKASYMVTTKEVPVITYNDMASIAKCNSIVFRAGDSVVWNRNETALPMSFRLLHMNGIKMPGKKYSLQTIPTLSTAVDFDIKKNQPDFSKMLKTRMRQATYVEECMSKYQELFEYSDEELAKLDLDVYAQDIMEIVSKVISAEDAIKRDEKETQRRLSEDYGDSGVDTQYDASYYFDDDDPESAVDYSGDMTFDEVDNEDLADIRREADEKMRIYEERIYGQNSISKSALVGMDGSANHQLDEVLLIAYIDVMGEMQHDKSFICRDNNLYSIDTDELFIERLSTDKLEKLAKKTNYDDEPVYSDEEIEQEDIQQFGGYRITDEFIKYLASLDRWTFASGRFDEAVGRAMMRKG